MGLAGARASLPVVCVGNVTVGGSGKTPAAIAIAAALRGHGWRPAFLTRGHGGELAGPVLVDPARQAFPQIGDEACLLARHAPTVVARDRPAGAALAASIGADILVMDDGLQNASLIKDLGIAVFDGAVGIGNGRILPAGPLRAPLAAQWQRVDAVLIVGPGLPGEEIARHSERRGLPVLRAAIEPDPQAAGALRGRRVLAFAGIGRPDKFFATLREIGAQLAATRGFADHHPFGIAQVRRLLDRAERDDLLPVTTEKDLARLSPYADAEPRIARIRALPVTLAFAEPDVASQLLLRHLSPKPGSAQLGPFGDGMPSRFRTASGDA